MSAQRKILVTGAAGFIGAHVCQALLREGSYVIGVDNVNNYYCPNLKRDRLKALVEGRNFTFYSVDVSDHKALGALSERREVTHVIHLAAQAGVRHSIDNPMAYGVSNLMGHLSILEFCRHAPALERLVYGSSSSVYGLTRKTPYQELTRVDKPVSLYAATKASAELLSSSYAALYGFPQVGLRFFTVYGPWGRPDMAYWLFTEAILQGRPINIFNGGAMRRDFTYIDDIVAGVLATTFQPLPRDRPAHTVYNIGNNKPVELMTMIRLLEEALGRKAQKNMMPMQLGDVVETCADITKIKQDFGFEPSTSLENGLPRFVDWYREYIKA